MKNILLVSLILCVCALSLNANNDKEKKEKKTKKEKTSWFKKTTDAPYKQRRLLFALDLSPTISNLKGKDQVINDGRRFNFSYGLTVQYNIDSKYSVITGAKLISRGGKYRNFDPITYQANSLFPLEMPKKTLAKLRLRSLQIPVLGRITAKAAEGKNMRIYGQAGLGFDINMRARATFKNDYDGYDFKMKKVDVSNEFKGFNVSWLLGVGAIHAWNEKFDAYTGIGFSRAIGNIAKKDAIDKLNSKALTIDLGIIF